MPDRPSSSGDEPYRWRYGESPRGGTDQPGTDDTQQIPAPGTPGTDDPPAAPPRSRTPPPADPDRRRQRPPQPGQQPGQQPLPPPDLPPPGSRAGQVPRDDGAPAPAPRPAHSRARIARRVVLVLVLVWLLFVVLVPIWAWSKIDKVDASPDGDRPADQPGTTFLVVGSDSRDGLSEEERQDLATGDVGGMRTDTIMLLHTGNGPTTLVSLPRDSPVEVPGNGTTKINAAFALGGAELLVETVEQNTGIRVDGYIEIGLGGFVNIVDALGGVEICPTEAIADPKAGLDIAAGCQEADGPTALGYARTRDFVTADLQRVQNQREVVSAIADEAASPWTLLNPWRYFRLASAGSASLSIGDDVSPIDLGRFAWALGEVSGGGKTCTVPLANGSADWDLERSEQMFRLVRDDRTDELGELCSKTGL